MFLNKILKSFFIISTIFSLSIVANAADYNLRMTMNSNDQDEDYDGSIVFKNYVESASNGAIQLSYLLAHNFVPKELSAYKVYLMVA